MSKKIITIIISGIIVLIAGWWSNGGLFANKSKKIIKKNETNNSLLLIIKSNKKVYKITEPIMVEVKLKNVGKKTLIANTGALDYLTLFLKFKIIDSNGIEVEQIPRQYAPPQFDKDKDFFEFIPEQSINKVVDISEIWCNRKKGDYSITAIYNIPAWCNTVIYEHEPEFKKININAWSGTITSEAITLKIK